MTEAHYCATKMLNMNATNRAETGGITMAVNRQISLRAPVAAFCAAAMLVALTATASAQTTAPAPSTPAANPCTNVDEAKCPTVAGCIWLPGFKVKGAADVPGYCRTAPKPLTTRRTGDPAPAAKQ
jgi:hypothetical protein